jgi:PqqA peptide cyclase
VVDPPYSLLAELTHACPLQCAYCSNPVDLRGRELELTTDEWKKAIVQAAKIGILQIHFSGGEPLIRQDLEELVSVAKQVGIYSNLITSGISLTHQRMQALVKAGINSVQISVQDSDNDAMFEVIGMKALSAKLDACSIVKEANIPLTINIVLHRQNIDRLEQMVLQAINTGASRVEIANAQYYGWAFLNRSYLIPTVKQAVHAKELITKLRTKHPSIEIIYVLCDYLQDLPKPCMGGWGSLHLTIDPAGIALPCPAARVIKSLEFPSVRTTSLLDIWFHSNAFNAFRGNSWMLEPCQSCERKDLDHGGCRCQSFMYTGEARLADPVCKYSEDRYQVDEAISNTGRGEPCSPSMNVGTHGVPLPSGAELHPILRTFNQPA